MSTGSGCGKGRGCSAWGCPLRQADVMQVQDLQGEHVSIGSGKGKGHAGLMWCEVQVLCFREILVQGVGVACEDQRLCMFRDTCYREWVWHEEEPVEEARKCRSWL